jgi:hypothetical protein
MTFTPAFALPGAMDWLACEIFSAAKGSITDGVAASKMRLDS